MTIRVFTTEGKVGKWSEYHNVADYQQVPSGLQIRFKDGLLVYLSSFTNVMEIQ